MKTLYDLACAQQLCLALTEAGMTKRSFAKQLGVTVHRLEAAIRGRSGRMRRMIEARLKMPIWTDLARFEQINKLTDSLGFDPLLTSVIEMRRFAARNRVRTANWSPNRAELIAAFQNHFSNKTPTTR